MKLAVVLALAGLLAPVAALAHPHVVSQAVASWPRTASTPMSRSVEIDPVASEDEIRQSTRTGRVLGRGNQAPGARHDAGTAEVRLMTGSTPAARILPGPSFRPAARIDDPPTFTPADWDRSEGHRDGMPMPSNKQAQPFATLNCPRNVYTARRAATKSPSITTYDPGLHALRGRQDEGPAGCALAKHPTRKSNSCRAIGVRRHRLVQVALSPGEPCCTSSPPICSTPTGRT